MNNIPLPNNGMFAKDINSESGSQYSLLRHLYQKQGSTSQMIEPTKKWMPNGNRDASSRINHRRAIQISRDMSSTQLPNSSNNSDLQTIQQAKNKCRNQGYCVPPKLAASPHGHIISSVGTVPMGTAKPSDYCTRMEICHRLNMNRLESR